MFGIYGEISHDPALLSLKSLRSVLFFSETKCKPAKKNTGECFTTKLKSTCKNSGTCEGKNLPEKVT